LSFIYSYIRLNYDEFHLRNSSQGWAESPFTFALADFV